MLVTPRLFKEKYFSDELRSLIKKGEVKSKDKLYYVSGYKPVDWHKRRNHSLGLMKMAKELAKPLGLIPWIKMAAVTGAVAAFGADEKADIDLFIVSAKNRVWLTRLFTVLILKTLGKYRTDKDPVGKVCPNLFVDEGSMNWPKDKRNLLVAHEIVMMHPIINRHETYFKFIKANQWIFEHFKHFHINFAVRKRKETTASNFINFLENACRKIQISYMKKKMTTEIAQKNLIHFNRDDWTGKILDKYESLISSHQHYR